MYNILSSKAIDLTLILLKSILFRSFPTFLKGDTLSPKLKLNIASLATAADNHEGFVRIHSSIYLGQGAQRYLEAIAVRIEGSDATILSEAQIIILTPSRCCNDKEELKKLFTSFERAVMAWWENLDEIDYEIVTYRQIIAPSIYSTTGPLRGGSID